MTLVARTTHVLHVLNLFCWFFPRLFLTLSHLPLTWFLEILFKLFTVVWFCCTFLTPCSTYDTLKTHCCTLWTRCCTSYTRSPRICWILSSSLTLSRFLPLTWFLEILFKLFTVVWFCYTSLTPSSTSATLLHVLHTYATLLHILHTRTPRIQPYLRILSSSLPDFDSLEFLNIFSNFSTVVRFCSTFYTRLARSTHVRTRLARYGLVVTPPTRVRHVQVSFFTPPTTHVLHVLNHMCWYFLRLFLILSLFLDFL